VFLEKMSTNLPTDSIAPLRHFVTQMTHLIGQSHEESFVRPKAKALLKELIASDDWLPEFCTVPHPQFYQQYLLYADPLERFSVVSFVWGPGQVTPIHDHMVWGLIGMLRGSERGQRYERDADESLKPVGREEALMPGDIDEVSPTIGDIHIVKNAFADKTSISIHVYGGNIGGVKRHVYDPSSGAIKNFVSGYSSTQVPNLWDRSAEIRAQLS
jgi:predicted metal-dependent enzyme (double-stranded beta helix superfamily)